VAAVRAEEAEAAAEVLAAGQRQWVEQVHRFPRHHRRR